MKASKGEVMFYNKIKGRQITAINGTSSAGKGWRPVCAGSYLGSQCFDTEKGAINYGIIIVEQLKARADACRDRSQCRIVEESPPVQPVKKKRNSKKQESV